MARQRALFPANEKPTVGSDGRFFGIRLKRGSLINRRLEPFTGFKLWLLGCRYLDRLASARIAAGGRLAVGNAESTETNETDFGTASQCAGDGIENTINGFCRIGFGKARTTGYGSNEIIFIHGSTPSVGGGWLNSDSLQHMASRVRSRHKV